MTSRRLPSLLFSSLSRGAHVNGSIRPRTFAPWPRSFGSTPRTSQQVKYVRFGDSGSGGGSRWKPFGQWDNPSKLLAGAVGSGTVYYVYHLERVEETGRWRFIDVSPESEKQIGVEAEEQVLSQYKDKILPPNHPLTKRVTNVAARIITSAGLGYVKNAPRVAAQEGGWDPLPGSFGSDDNFAGSDSWVDGTTASQRSVIERLRQEWEVVVIKDDKTPNAFVTGGGKIFVFTGLLPIAQNDDGIATVIGHEIAHQVQRHSAEKMSGAKVFGALVLLLEILGLDVGVSRIGLTLALTLPNSRTMETEADNVGLRLMAQACYNPRESVRMWARMAEMEKQRGGGLFGMFNLGSADFLQTHPASEKRMATLEKQVPSALSVRAGSSCGSLDGGMSIADGFGAFVEVLPRW